MTMAKYMMIFRGGMGARQDSTASPDQMQAHMQKWFAWIGGMRAQTEVTGDPLQNGGATIKGPGKTVTDGSYAELKDLVSGFLIVGADSQDAANEMAKGCPIFEDDSGSVEVRRVMDMGDH
jgi:hypothetical protein